MFGARLRALARQLNFLFAASRLKALRRDIGRLLRIEPVFVAANRGSFLEASARANLPQRVSGSEGMYDGGDHFLRRFCLCCNETTPMRMDDAVSLVHADGTRTHNWRESLVCTRCGMNNRQRLVAKLVQQDALRFIRPSIYLMEQVTPIFEWVRELPGAKVYGSEYLGYGYTGGQRIDGVRHEDVMNLSYPDESFDLIVSNDVLEHIPDPARALHECFRVLKPGGSVLATFPFHVTNETTVSRARLVGRTIEHLLPPQYHGNPLSSQGSLVFRDFGWDMLEVMRVVGFAPAACEVYSSDAFGHLGPPLHVFRLGKPSGCYRDSGEALAGVERLSE